MRWTCVAVLLLGLAARAAPMFSTHRVFRQWPTEDGYLMLTIARNIAIGKGMSTADGTLLTNGTQPLMTLVYGAGFALAGGDRWGGVMIAHAISIAAAAAGAWMLYRLGLMLLRERPGGDLIALAAAAIWFASPIISGHSMNMLETGAYATMCIACVLAFLTPSGRPAGSWPLARVGAFGVLLGLTFLCRMDAVFLIFAICIARVLSGVRDGGAVLRRRLAETLAFGAISVVVSTPWLYYNWSEFGSLMPISGRSEGLEATLGRNLPKVPGKLAEYLMLTAQIPERLETTAPGLAFSLAVTLGGLGAAAVAFRRGSEQVRAAVLVVGIFAAGLAGYYGVVFGAGWFLSRYLMPISPFLFLLSAASIVWVVERIRFLPLRPVLGVAAAGVLGLAVFGHARYYIHDADYGHFPVVDWVQANVPDDAWVAAVQTGTLGFFHDRTINLDGKVNPEALRLRMEAADGPEGERELDEYILSKRVQYMADWAKPMRAYARHELLSRHFEVAVMKPEGGGDPYGLGALRRTTPVDAPIGPEGTP